MKSLRRLSLMCGLVLASVAALGWTLTWAQAKATPATPLALMPAGTVLLTSADGDAIHKIAWEKTAAFEAFRQSGLMDSLTNLVREVLEQAPGGQGQNAMQVYEFVSEHGLTASIGLPAGEGPAIPYLTAVAHDAGPHADLLAQFVQGLGPQAKVTRQKVSGRSVSRVMLPETPGVELAWWAEGKHLVVTVGMGAVEAAIAVADGKSPSFVSTAQGKKLAAKPGFDRTALVLLDVAILRNRFGTIPLPPDGQKTVTDVLQSLGLDSLNHVLVQSGYKGRSLWSTIDVDAPGARKGLLGLADPKTSTMTMDDLPPLPVNNVGFVAQSLSLSNAYDKVIELAHAVAKLGPPDAEDQLDELLDQIPEILGCDLRNDILAPLGSVQCIYSDSNQGLLGAAYGVAFRLSDAPKLRETVTKLLGRIKNEVPEEYLAGVQRKKHGQNLITLQIAAGAFNPTFLIDDKWLCLGLSSQTVEAFALRLKGDLPSWKPDAETAEALAVVPKKFSSISVAYPRQTYRGLISAGPLLLGFAQIGMVQARQFAPIPLIDLTETTLDFPPAELVAKPLFPNVAWSVIDETGIHMTTRSSAPAIPLIGGADGSTLAVSAVLVALLVPAVQQAREAARRTQSKNNLRQIGLAMHNFHDTHNHFPQGTIPSKKLKPEERQSWLVPLLPYMDQAPLYNSMNVNLQESVQWDDDALEAANRRSLPALQNPSQPQQGFQSGEPATTDYAGWAGVGKDAPTEKSKPEKKGVFGYERATRIGDITDGTSNTVMVSDVVAKGRGPWAQGGTATIRALTAKPYVNGPDGIGSPHVGGFHVLMCDGSVRFVSQNIDPGTLEKLATRAGGEVIGDF